MRRIETYEKILTANFDRLFLSSFERVYADLVAQGVDEDLAETRAYLAAENWAYDEAVRQTEAQLSD